MTIHVVQVFEQRADGVVAAEPKTGPSAASARALQRGSRQTTPGSSHGCELAIQNSETGSLLVELVRTGTLPDEFEVSGGVER